MARKEKLYHYIYKTTCKITNNFYVGMHSTDSLNDGYIGSGKRLAYSVRKHGKENHITEIIEFLPDRSSLIDREKKIINEKFLQDPFCMNLKLGGEGGFISDEHVKKLSKAGNDKFLEKLKDESYKQEFKNKLKESRNSDTNGYSLPEYSKKLTEANKKNWSDPNSTYNSEGYRKSVGRKGHTNQTGEKNSQFGTIWVSRNGEVKKIKKELFDEYSSNGWFKGMKS